jgi:hypothetical protein
MEYPEHLFKLKENKALQNISKHTFQAEQVRNLFQTIQVIKTMTGIVNIHNTQPQEISQNHHKWNGLPLVRTSHTYAVYSVDLFQALSPLHEANTNLSSLVKEIAQMEHQGPIHVRNLSWLVLVISYSCAFRIPLVLAVRRDALLCIYPSKGNHHYLEI